MVERLSCKQEVTGSSPVLSTVTEPKMEAGLACEASISEFNSRQSPQMEDAAKWLATGLENQGRVTPRGSIPPSSFTDFA
jgi:hypothetical protein